MRVRVCVRAGVGRRAVSDRTDLHRNPTLCNQSIDHKTYLFGLLSARMLSVEGRLVVPATSPPGADDEDEDEERRKTRPSCCLSLPMPVVPLDVARQCVILSEGLVQNFNQGMDKIESHTHA